MTTVEPGVTGRKAGNARSVGEVSNSPRGPPLPSLAQKLAYTITEFCALHNISRAHYYAMKKSGRGPAEMNADGKHLISREASAAWRRACEVAAQTEATA